jgi:nucleoside-diphosphate-sugar epimerase
VVKRVLLTGATGFIGRHAISPLLGRGFDVHVLGRSRPDPATQNGASWHQVDLLDVEEMKAAVEEIGASHLLHFAWYTEHGKYWEAPENLDWVALSLHLIRTFHLAGGRRAVVAGTCAEYDWSGDCCDATTPLTPASLYGASKNALREVLDAYARSSELSAAWARVFFTYGPAEQPNRVIAAVSRALVTGEPVRCSPGLQVRDFLYVEDVADAFAALLDSTATGALDIGSGEGVRLRDILLRLEQIAGRRDLVRFDEALQRQEPARIVADTRRLQSELQWRPGYELDEGLERTLSWWRASATEP